MSMSTTAPLYGTRGQRAALQPTSHLERLTQLGKDLGRRGQHWFSELSSVRKVAVVVAALIILAIGLFVAIFHKFVIEVLVHVSNKWEHFKWGKTILFFLIFFVGFPPLLGFSPLSLLCGMVYGFPYGWPLLAVASVLGLFASFLVFRYLLHNQAERMVHSHEQFRAFADVLKEDSSLFILILLRLCPLPYSLSNGALAAIPELPAWRYLLASVITSPKMLIHVFVGHKLRELGLGNRSTTTKVVDAILILITGVASAATTYLIYSKMQVKIEYYHQQRDAGDYDELIFGNMDDSSANVELDLTDFDADNFVIGDEDELDHLNQAELESFAVDSDPELPSLNLKAKKNTRGFRDT